MVVSPSVTCAGQLDQSELRRFRNDFYDCLGARQDALFEVLDGICSPIPISGVAHTSLAATVLRGHGSAYAALARGSVDVDAVRDLLVSHLPARVNDFAVDTTLWKRDRAQTSSGRGYFYDANASGTGRTAVRAGWLYLLIVGIAATRDSWTAPVDAIRANAQDTITTLATQRIHVLLPRLDRSQATGASPAPTPQPTPQQPTPQQPTPQQPTPQQPTPLFVFDAGFNAVALTVELANTPAQILVRLRNDRRFYHRPPADNHGQRGRPRRHGHQMRFTDPDTWQPADTTAHSQDPDYGHVTVQAWHHLHPAAQHTYRDTDHTMSIIEATIIRLQVSKLPGRANHHHPPPIWLWWTAPEGTPCDLDRIWRAYLRRFAIEHTIKFAKRVLGWTTPKIRTPQQADHWTWLIWTAHTQLRLARDLITDHRLPWHKPLPTGQRTPGRVRQSFTHLLPQLGTPATPPKTSHPGPGRPKGSTSTPAPRHPPHKKPTVKPPKKVKPS